MGNTKYGRTYHIRLQGEQHTRFERVYDGFKGLPASVVLRMIVTHCISEKNETELSAIVEAGIRGEETTKSRVHSRVSETNARKGRH